MCSPFLCFSGYFHIYGYLTRRFNLYVSGLYMMEEYSSATCFFLTASGTWAAPFGYGWESLVSPSRWLPLHNGDIDSDGRLGCFQVFTIIDLLCWEHSGYVSYLRLSPEVKFLSSRTCTRCGWRSPHPAMQCTKWTLLTLVLFNACQSGGQRAIAHCVSLSYWGQVLLICKLAIVKHLFKSFACFS